jgi:hypothetical protein
LSNQLEHQGQEPTEDMLARAKQRIDAMNARLNPEQRQAVANVCVFGKIPMWFFVERGCGGQALPENATQRAALLSGLEVLVRL